MKRSILEVYALAVCFVTVVCFVVATGMAIYAIVGIANPEFTMSSWTYEQHQTNDAFYESPRSHHQMGPNDKRVRPEESVLTGQRVESFARVVASERRDSGQTLVKSLIVILIDMIVFYAHWLLGRRARATAA